MKLTKVTIKNFMALRDISLVCRDVTALVGENNVGKSSVLLALDAFYSTGISGIRTGHFHRQKTEGTDVIEREVNIECEFDSLSDREKEAFRTRLYEDKLILQKKYTLNDDGKIEVIYRTKSKIYDEEYLKLDSTVPNRQDVEAKGWREFYPPSGKITKDQHEAAKAQIIARTNPSFSYDYVDNPKGWQNQCDKYLPEYHLIPAVREATDELKITQTSKLSGLISAIINRIVKRHPSFEKLKQNVDEIQKLFSPETREEERIPGFDRIAGSLSEELSRHIKAKVDLRPAIPDPSEFFKLGMNVSIDDGISGELDEKGHGLQRSFIIAMFLTYGRLLRKIEQEYPLADDADAYSPPLIFAFEEPELFLHPQLQRTLYDTIREIAGQNQVMYCTHSPFFVDMNNYKDIKLLKKADPDGSAIALQCETELFAAPERKALNKLFRIRNEVDTKSEMFFAKKIVLIEGACEKHCYPVIGKRMGIFDHSVTLVDCGGNESIPLYQELLNAFQLPYLVVTDQDPTKPESQAVLADINALARLGKGTVLLQEPDFEDAAGCDKGLKDKPLRALKHFSDEGNVISAKMQEYARKIYSLS